MPKQYWELDDTKRKVKEVLEECYPSADEETNECCASEIISIVQEGCDV